MCVNSSLCLRSIPSDDFQYDPRTAAHFVILLSSPPVFSSATPVIATPSSKRKLPLESGHSFGFSNKKRRSVKKNLGIDLLPNTFFSGTSTPGSGTGDVCDEFDAVCRRPQSLLGWTDSFCVLLRFLQLLVRRGCWMLLRTCPHQPGGPEGSRLRL